VAQILCAESYNYLAYFLSLSLTLALLTRRLDNFDSNNSSSNSCGP